MFLHMALVAIVCNCVGSVCVCVVFARILLHACMFFSDVCFFVIDI